MKKTILTVASVLLLALVSTACSQRSNNPKIGIIQLVEHPALDASYKGFVDGLKEAGYVDGQNIDIDYENAQGD